MKLEANTGELNGAADVISRLATEYEQASGDLLNAVQKIHNNGWGGDDAEVYMAKIGSLSDDFEKMAALLRAAAKDLLETKQLYDNTQHSASSAAAGLSSSF